MCREKSWKPTSQRVCEAGQGGRGEDGQARGDTGRKAAPPLLPPSRPLSPVSHNRLPRCSSAGLRHTPRARCRSNSSMVQHTLPLLPLPTNFQLRVFAAHPQGIVSVKFITGDAADECVKLMNGRYFGGRQVEAGKWDGYTNFNVKVGRGAGWAGGRCGSSESVCVRHRVSTLVSRHPNHPHSARPPPPAGEGDGGGAAGPAGAVCSRAGGGRCGRGRACRAVAAAEQRGAPCGAWRQSYGTTSLQSSSLVLLLVDTLPHCPLLVYIELSFAGK